MVTVLVTSFLLFAAISYAIYWWQRSSSNENPERVLPPARAVGLFGEMSRADEAALLAAEREAERSARRESLLERAVAGDKKVLDEAQASGDTELYDEALDALTERADSDESLLALVSYVARSEALRVNARLAAKFIESWKRSPDRGATAKMLHVAALCGEAGLYRQAIETAFQLWSDGRVPSLSAGELRQLVESEYWILPAVSRSSGAGFVLKRTLARLRRELAASTNGQA
ncbi:MAG: hypothetical protein QOF02_1479 [Blastocatellia bacterium]|jgi:hypothetical protein|nr:hypothetical protein [Blastocatellia bacterium]